MRQGFLEEFRLRQPARTVQRALAGSGRAGRLGDVKSGSHQRALWAVQADQAVQKK